jgi:hypothetical protein
VTIDRTIKEPGIVVKHPDLFKHRRVETMPRVRINVSNNVTSVIIIAAKYQAAFEGMIDDSKNNPYNM